MAGRIDRIGQQVGEYRILRWLGGGGFGDVYLGEHLHEHTQIAIKILHGMLTRHDDLKEFINEARTIHLKHPNILSLLDFGISSDSTPFLVMIYAPHGTLRDRHPKGSQLPLSIIVSYVQQLASALQYAHSMHLVHRDVKPENMLVGPNYEILLSDFGIAEIVHSSRSLATENGIGGTLPYMAPEQIAGKPRSSSDQYALGIVVYEWITGRRPFTGTAAEIAMQHTTTPPLSLRERVPTLSIEVEQVIMRTLEKDPQNRFANIELFAKALKQAIQLVKTPKSATEHPSSIRLVDSPSARSLVEQKNVVQHIETDTPLTPIPTVSFSGIKEMVLVTQPVHGPGATYLITQSDSDPSGQEPIESRFSSPKIAIKQSLNRRRLSRKTAALLLVLALLILGSASGLYTIEHIFTVRMITKTTATATVNANIILSDPLTKNIFDWPQQTNGSTVYIFKDGAYHITDNDNNQGASAILPDRILQGPFVYTLTMEEIKGDDTSVNNEFGMIFRATIQSKAGKIFTRFYSLEVLNTSGGEYQFWKYDDSQGPNSNLWGKLDSHPFGSEFHIGKGPKSINTFKLIANDKNFSLVVNGKKAWTFQDGSFATGSVGMLVNLKGTEVAYSNLTLTHH